MNATHPAGAFAALLSVAALSACESNPPLAPIDDHGGEFDVEITRDRDHVHTLGEGVTFTVTITDHDGAPATDFEVVSLERRLEGSDSWRQIELERVGDAYSGSYVFTTSGEYHLRVTALEHGEQEPTVLHEAHDPLHVGRAHADLGSWRVEFESSPGHVHEGDEAALTFWVLEEHENGERHPVEGLTPMIHVRMEEGGAEELVDAEEHEPGVYEAHYHFEKSGEVHAGLHAADGGEAAFQFHVVHAH